MLKMTYLGTSKSKRYIKANESYFPSCPEGVSSSDLHIYGKSRNSTAVVLITGKRLEIPIEPSLQSTAISTLALSLVYPPCCLPWWQEYPFPETMLCLFPAGEWGPSSVTLAHVHFIVPKLCNSAGLIYEGCISSSDPCWYRTHYFAFMCLCQRATGNQLLETDVKKKKPNTTKPFINIVILFQVPVPAYSLCKEGNGDCGCRLTLSLL